MEPMVVLTMTRSEFDKLATGWFVSQQLAGHCSCETCTSVNELLADAMEELMAFDEMVAEMEAIEDILDYLKSDPTLNRLMLMNSHPQYLIQP